MTLTVPIQKTARSVKRSAVLIFRFLFNDYPAGKERKTRFSGRALLLTGRWQRSDRLFLYLGEASALLRWSIALIRVTDFGSASRRAEVAGCWAV